MLIRITFLIVCLMLITTPIKAQEDYQPSSALEVITAENADQIELVGYLGHGEIKYILWSPDKTLMAIANRQGVYLYNADDLTQPPHFLMSEGGIMTQVAFSADGRYLAFSTGDNTGVVNVAIRLWDVETMREVATYHPCPATGIASSFAFHPNSNILSYLDCHHVRIVDTHTGDPIYSFARERVNNLLYSPNGELLALTDAMGTLYLYDGHQPTEPIDTIPTPFTTMYSDPLYFSPDSNTIVVAHDSVFLWNIATQQSRMIPRQARAHLQFDQDNHLIMAMQSDLTQTSYPSHDNEQVQKWDIETGEMISSTAGIGAIGICEDYLVMRLDRLILQWHQNGTTTPLINQLSERHWVADDCSQIAFVNAPDDQCRCQRLTLYRPENEAIQRLDFLRPVSSYELAISPTGDQLVVLDRTVYRLWEITPDLTFTHHWVRSAYRSYLTQPTFAPNGQLAYGVWLGGYDLNTGGFELENQTFVGNWQTNETRTFPNKLAFSPDGQYVAAGYQDGWVRVYDVEQISTLMNVGLHQGAEVFMYQTPNGTVWDMVFTPDGSTLIIGSGNFNNETRASVFFMDMPTGEIIQEIDLAVTSIVGLEIIPNSNHLAIGTAGLLRVYDLEANTFISEIQFPPYIQLGTNITYSPDGTLFMVTGYDNFSVYRADTGELLISQSAYTGGLGGINALFHPSGKLIISVAADQTIRLWGIPTLDDDTGGV